MNKYFMCNVVWYDGVDANVSKFILRCNTNPDAAGTKDFATPTADSLDDVRDYLQGNGEVLKVDPLYDMSLDNIIALKGAEHIDNDMIYTRFKNMYF